MASRLQAAGRRLWTQLPKGAMLRDDAFAQRHRIVVMTLWVLIGGLAVLGLASSEPPTHVLESLALPLVPTIAAVRTRTRTQQMLMAGLALPMAAAALVHLTNGLVESHFLFFVLLPVVALYQDWRAFLGAIGAVFVHHAFIGTFVPLEVYNHEAALASPLLWAAIHTGYVAALAIVMIVHWNLSEAEQQRLRDLMVEHREVQEDLLTARKLEAVGQLAAGVAHEINTPIQFVSHNLSFLERNLATLVDAARRAPEDGEDLAFVVDELPTAIAESQEGIRRVSDIVDAMGGIAHPHAEELQDVDVNKLVTDAVTVSRSAWRYDAELDLELDEQLEPVRCVPGHLLQVLLNLIVNAAQAIEDQHRDDEHVELGRITVATAAVDGMLSITVSDDGCGIPDEVMPRIFDDFFTTKQTGRGSGQGLSLAHRMVTAAHGRIVVESTVGHGSRFEVLLPLDGEEPDVADADAVDAAMLTGSTS